MVEEAIDETYFEADDAFRSVVDRLRSYEGIDVEGGHWDVARRIRRYRVSHLRRLVALVGGLVQPIPGALVLECATRGEDGVVLEPAADELDADGMAPVG